LGKGTERKGTIAFKGTLASRTAEGAAKGEWGKGISSREAFYGGKIEMLTNRDFRVIGDRRKGKGRDVTREKKKESTRLRTT